MASVSVESLKKQLEVSKQEFEAAKAHVYRVDSAIQLLEHLIKAAEEEPTSESSDSDKAEK